MSSMVTGSWPMSATPTQARHCQGHPKARIASFGDMRTGFGPSNKVRAIAADTTHPATFFCGGSRNFHKFLDIFDKVFVLDVDVETLNRRLDGRPNEPGFDPAERRLILRYHHTREHLPVGINIDTAGTIPSVVDNILAQLA